MSYKVASAKKLNAEGHALKEMMKLQTASYSRHSRNLKIVRRGPRRIVKKQIRNHRSHVFRRQK